VAYEHDVRGEVCGRQRLLRAAAVIDEDQLGSLWESVPKPT